MRKKDLSYLCDYFKAFVISDLPDDFSVAESFRHGLADNELRKGMMAFRDFLRTLFDTIRKNKDKIDVTRGRRYNPYGTPGDRGTASVKDCFPVFFDLTIILLTLGFHGKLTGLTAGAGVQLSVRGEDMLTFVDPITEKYQSVIRMSGERKLEMFHLLSEAGLHFDGADFSREVDFSKIETFYIASIKNDLFAVGLKLIAEAMINNKNYYKLENLFFSILLRGDYSPLANITPKKVHLSIKEYACAHPLDIKEWIMDINELLINNGCKLVQGMGGGPPFTYTKRNIPTITKGMVCIIEMGVTGCYLIPGVNHLEKPNQIINMLPDYMVDMIKSGKERTKFNPEQCYRRSGNMKFARFAFTVKGEEFEGCRHAGLRCQYSGVKCRFTGYRYDLSDPDIRKWMWKWIEMELS